MASGWKSCQCLVQSHVDGQGDANGFSNLHSPFISLSPAGPRESDTNKTLTGRQKSLCRCHGTAQAFDGSEFCASLPRYPRVSSGSCAGCQRTGLATNERPNRRMLWPILKRRSVRQHLHRRNGNNDVAGIAAPEAVQSWKKLTRRLFLR